jgi:hypothetical protein
MSSNKKENIPAGKGSVPRPIEVPREQFESNWDKVFGKRNK